MCIREKELDKDKGKEAASFRQAGKYAHNVTHQSLIGVFLQVPPPSFIPNTPCAHTTPVRES